MEHDNEYQPSPQKEDKPEEFSDDLTKNKVGRHLTDINDAISKEDIKNINTDIGSAGAPVEKTNEADEKPQDDAKKDDDDDVRPPMPTPWNALG